MAQPRQQHLDLAAIAAVLVAELLSLAPLLIAPVSWAVLGERMSAAQVLGMTR